MTDGGGNAAKSEFLALAVVDNAQVLDTFLQRTLVALAFELDAQAQLVLRLGVADGVLVADQAFLEQVEQRLVESLHAQLPGFGHDFLDRGYFALEDQVGDILSVDHDFRSRDAALAALAADQALGDEGAHVERQVHEQLRAAFRREAVEYAVERLVGAVGVQRREHQVTGFGEGHRIVHGVLVADLADEDHIRRLQQGVFARDVPGAGMHTDLTLGDDAVDMRMHELDGGFNGADVIVGVLVAVADHRGNRGGLARAGGAHEDNDAAFRHHQVFQHWRQPELVESGNIGIQRAQHRAHAALLHKGADAETPDARRTNGELALLGGVKFLGLAVIHDGPHQDAGLLHCQGLVGGRGDLPVHLDGGWKPRGDEQVRTLARHHGAQQVLQIGR